MQRRWGGGVFGHGGCLLSPVLLNRRTGSHLTFDSSARRGYGRQTREQEDPEARHRQAVRGRREVCGQVRRPQPQGRRRGSGPEEVGRQAHGEDGRSRAQARRTQGALRWSAPAVANTAMWSARASALTGLCVARACRNRRPPASATRAARGPAGHSWRARRRRRGRRRVVGGNLPGLRAGGARRVGGL